jgi:hypothetical protein
MNTIHQEALRLNNLGFKVFPISKDTKQPTCKSWRQYEQPHSQQQISELFKNKNGIALACCDNVEVIDVDLKYSFDDNLMQKLLDSIIEVVGVESFLKLVIASTKNNGYHIIYKTNVIEPQSKLASRLALESEKKHPKDKIRCFLETRSLGGYIAISPTEGYNWDEPNKQLDSVQFITDKERNKIIQCCRDFDEIGEIYKQKQSHTPKDVKVNGKSTIEAFNEAHTPLDFLIDAGWQYKNHVGQNSRYVRPGKSLREGHGATYHEDLNRFYVFTSSTEFEPDTSYDAFATYAVLYHNNDTKAAWKDLYHKGYGERLTKKTESHSQKLEIITSGHESTKEQLQDLPIMQEIETTRFDVNRKPIAKPSTLYCWDPYKQDYVGIGGDGEMITFLGAAGSGKSSISSMACACAMEGGMQEALMFKGDFQNRAIIHLDTEQGEIDYYRTCKEMLWQSVVPNGHNPNNFYSYRLTDYSLEQKVSFLDYIVNKIPNIGLVFLDGIVDLVQDFNDLKESKMLVSYVRALSSKHRFLLIPILHNARSTGSARGHTGAFLLEKSKAVFNCVNDKEMGHTTVKNTKSRGFSPLNDMIVEWDAAGHLQYQK